MSRIFVVPLPANKREREKERKGQRKKERHREIGRERERERQGVALAPLKITMFSPNKGFNRPEVTSHLTDMI